VTDPDRHDEDVAAAVRGESAAVRAVWGRHRRWVAAILLAHKPRESELDDLLQEVAVTLVSKVHELRDEAAIRPWLRSVALNVARAAGRRTSRERARRSRAEPVHAPGPSRSDTGDAGSMPDGASPDTPVQVREEGERLLDLARELPDGYREPLLMRCVRDMSYREIASVLELPETTIETRIARGRRMLRERLADLDARARRETRLEVEA